MGRLTRRAEDTWERKCIGIGVHYAYKFDWFYEALEKLAHYEDLEEAGRLIEIVRCSECEHYYTVGCVDGCGWCSHWDIGRFTDGYCDQAKLKELEGE